MLRAGRRLRRSGFTFKRCNSLDHLLKENDAVLFIDRKGRRYLKILRRGKKLEIRGELAPESLYGREEGSRVKFSTGENYLVLRPTYADLIPHLPRAAQVIYPKDTGPLLIWGDVCPGATVIEGGVGAGALTIALLRAVGPTGRLISYELREDFAAAARRNVATFFGDAPNWTIKLRDLYDKATRAQWISEDVLPWQTNVDLETMQTIVRVNGKESNRFRTNDMIFGIVPFLVELTKYFTLWPGDVIWMGTDGASPDIKHGDVVEIDITGIGTLRNRFVREAR